MMIKKYGKESVEYINGCPDFSPFSKHNSPWGNIDTEVKIPHMTENRNNGKWEYGKRPKGKGHNANYDIGNYAQADNELLNKLKLIDNTITINDVVNYRTKNKLTWHECLDCTTMYLIPRIIHNKCPHSGGVAESIYRMKLGCIELFEGF